MPLILHLATTSSNFPIPTAILVWYPSQISLTHYAITYTNIEYTCNYVCGLGKVGTADKGAMRCVLFT